MVCERKRNVKEDSRVFWPVQLGGWSCFILIGRMMRSLTFMHVKCEILSSHPREDVKADGRNVPGFKGEVLAGDLS